MGDREEIPTFRKTVPLQIKSDVWNGLSLLLKEAISSSTYGTVLNFPNGNIFRWIYREKYSFIEQRLRKELNGNKGSS